MVYALSDWDYRFPPTELAEPDGLLAIGGELSTPRLLMAYASGIFPWYNEGDEPLWYSPPERCVIYPQQVKVSKSMRVLLRKNVFEITENRAFTQVVKACAEIERNYGEGTWISRDILHAYTSLHNIGRAASVEVWQNGELAGGLYGVLVGSVFCGESMFSYKPNASKAALIYLCQTNRFSLIDCQLPNEHLLSMGAVMIKRKAFEDYLP